MPTPIRCWMLLAACWLGACSDDPRPAGNPRDAVAGGDTPAADTAAGDGAATDARRAEQRATDWRQERSAEDVRADLRRAELGTQDAAPATDALRDAAAATDARRDAVTPTGLSVHGEVTRSIDPMLDAKGKLYVALYPLGLPAPSIALATSIQDVYLKTKATKASYEIKNVAPGSYQFYAFLDDNANALPFPLMPDEVDLVTKTVVQVKVEPTSSLRVDAVLDAFANPDSATQGVRGTLRTTATPSGDGKGTIFLSLHTQLPPAGQKVALRINAADLGSPYATEVYYFAKPEPGNYYLRVFLDDNGNANAFSPAPDKGDLTTAQPVLVRVEQGVVTVRDVVLDKLFTP